MALPMAKRVVSAVVVGAVAAGVSVMASEAKPRASASRAAPKLTSHETGIHFTSNTIVVPKATVTHNLIGVSANGIFKFKRAAGPLAALKPGKVMLLQGSDAVVVTSIGHSHGQLLVHTKAASLAQLIKSGKIAFSGAPNFRNAFVAPTITAPGFKAASDIKRPSYPYVGAPPGSRVARTASVTF
jgi:hypothetical protein